MEKKSEHLYKTSNQLQMVKSELAHMMHKAKKMFCNLKKSCIECAVGFERSKNCNYTTTLNNIDTMRCLLE